MRILCEDAAGANRYISLSYAHAFQELGHEVLFWNEENKSTFDAFGEFEPTHALMHSWLLNRSKIKCLLARPHIKIILRVPHWGDWDCDRNLYPIQFATSNEIELAKYLTNHNIILTCQYPDDYVKKEKTHNNWGEIGPTYGIPLGLNTTNYFPVEPNDKYKYGWVWTGSRWPYKAQMMDPYLNPLMYPNSNLSHILIGGGFSGPNSVGGASEEVIRSLYSSSLVMPNVHEPHSQFVPDINQRTFETIGCFGFQVAQKVAGLDQLFEKDELFVVDNPTDMHKAVHYFVENPEKRIPWILKGALKTYAAHQNFHRVADVARLLGENDLAEAALAKAHEIFLLRQKQLVERYS